VARPESGDDYEKVFTEGYLFHTDEKEVLAGVLRQLLAGRRFASALDVGPGDGTMAAILAEHADRLTAVEPQAGFARKLRRRIPRVKIAGSLIQDVSFRKASFDLILASHMLYYIPLDGWDTLLERLLSWLKPGGLLLVVMSAGDSDWFRSVSELSRRLGLAPNFSYLAPEHFFKVAAGGADRIIPYDATFDFKGSSKQLEYFLVELELLAPRRLLSAEQKRLVARYVREKRGARGHFILKNRYLVGVWSAPTGPSRR
jgi:SAM-dependent methyltransferase